MLLFEVVFAGELMPGFQRELVATNLGRLFQADEQRVALLLSGRRLVIKSNLDATSAEKYRLTLARAGARVDVLAMDAEVEEVVLAPPPDAQPSADVPAGTPDSSRAGRLQVAPRDAYMAAFSDVDAPDFGIAPLGDDLQTPRETAQPPVLDLRSLSLAPVGADLGQSPAEEAPPAPDVSHLRLV